MYKSLFDIFMEEDKEPYEVTQTEWVNIKKDHYINKCNRSESHFNNFDKIEIECFHKEQVIRALENNIIVDKKVLEKYPGIIKEVQDNIRRKEDEKNKKENIPLFTERDLNSLKIGDKITINNQKVTVYKKEINSLICKLYRCRTKGIKLIIGDRYNIKMGWV